MNPTDRNLAEIARHAFGPFESQWPKAWRRGLVSKAAKPEKLPKGKATKVLAKGAGIVKISTPFTLIKTAPGVRVVSGVVTDESLDGDGQRASYVWAKAALQKWFDTGANLRRDHVTKGIGKGTRLLAQDGPRQLVLIGQVTNKAAIRDIDAGVLQCWSWGAKSVPGNPIKLRKGADGDEWIVGGEIVEVSLVDRGSNYNSRISVMPAQEVTV